MDRLREAKSSPLLAGLSSCRDLDPSRSAKGAFSRDSAATAVLTPNTAKYYTPPDARSIVMRRPAKRHHTGHRHRCPREWKSSCRPRREIFGRANGNKPKEKKRQAKDKDKEGKDKDKGPVSDEALERAQQILQSGYLPEAESHDLRLASETSSLRSR